MSKNNEDIVGQEFEQNCGDILVVLEKTEQKDKWGKVLFKYQFKKYFYIGLAVKNDIISKSILNPRIEQVEFFEKEWKQNCGDTLNILEKTKQKDSSGSYYYKCQFQKYPCEILASKRNIIKGVVLNPQIEQQEFIGQNFKQNCGDILKVSEKTEQKSGNHRYFKCQFQKYPCEVLALKRNILAGNVNNPNIEKEDFSYKIWEQKCGDKLKILKKTNEKESNGTNYLWKCEFIKYPCEVLASKGKILQGMVDNPALPWKTKDNLVLFLSEFYFEKIIMEDNFLNNKFEQNCGDTLIVLEKSDKKDNSGNYLYKYQFQKYFYEGFARKVEILKGKVVNPEIENNEFLNCLFLQNCGDTLKVIDKIKDSKGVTKYKYQFQKYFYEGVALKSTILKGQVNNPKIEEADFIGKGFEQNCGDILIVDSKDSEKLSGNYLYNYHFLNSPYQGKALKFNILKGTVNNPTLTSIIGKYFLQNCGDTLKVIDVSNKKGYYKYQFQKYFYEGIAQKQNILEGNINNPEIETQEFLNKSFEQNCGDSLVVLEKILKEHITYYKCKFKIYPSEVLALKSEILRGNVSNPALPWKSQANLLSYLKENNIKKISLTELAKLLNISVSTIGRAINNFGLRDYIDYSYSYSESQIKDYINSLNVGAESKTFGKDFKYKEIDIYIPSIKIGFEYNGNYWHSEYFKDIADHQEKTLLFKEKKIRIFSIFEYEWNDPIKQNVLKSYIKSKLCLWDSKFAARNCEVKVLNNNEYQNFCKNNHIQGEAGAKIKLGLVVRQTGELVEVMSFGVPRFTDQYEWEIIRQCSKCGYIIIGGEEKLWSYFIKNYNPNSCITYCDFSKFDGESYKRLGFEYKQLNKPGFVWWDEKENQVYWRNPFNHKEMAQKYKKIYDCGQLVFVWNKNV